MASKKKSLTQFCRIFFWIEQKDPDFAEAIDHLCLQGALSPGRNPGVTFLYPKDKGYREEIINMTYTDSAEDAMKMVESMIIPLPLKDSTAFKSQDIGSRLGVKLHVESATASEVKLKGGVTLKKAAGFKPLRRENLAVWEITSGRMPLEGEPFQLPRSKPKRGKKSVVGGANGLVMQPGGVLSDRAQMADDTEATYNKCMLRNRCRTHNPYLARVVSLLNFLSTKHSDILLAVLPVLDLDPAVSFYLLLEPYKTGGDYLIPDAVLFGPDGWGGAEVYQNAVTEYKEYFASMAKQTQPSAQDPSTGDIVVPWVFRDSQAVAAQADIVRQQIAGDPSAVSKLRTPKQVRDVYGLLATGNQIAGLAPILPDSTNRALQGSKKLWQDELRFILHNALEQLHEEPTYEVTQFAEVVRMLRFDRPGNDYGRESSLSSLELLRANVAPNHEFYLLVKFINSTDFLYMPKPLEIAGGDDEKASGGDHGGCPYDPRDWRLYDAHASKLRALLRSAEMDQARGISPAATMELRNYIARHGQLPPEFAPPSQPQPVPAASAEEP